MKISQLVVDGVWLVESPVWNDDRGLFREWFKAAEVKSATGRDFGIEQANISLSSAGTLRGIHYSIAPRGQAKWITCVSGSIQDVIVDIRPESKTFGQWIDVELKGDSTVKSYPTSRQSRWCPEVHPTSHSLRDPHC